MPMPPMKAGFPHCPEVTVNTAELIISTGAADGSVITEGNSNDAWIRYMDYGAFDTWRALEDKRYGRSVRCVKD